MKFFKKKDEKRYFKLSFNEESFDIDLNLNKEEIESLIIHLCYNNVLQETMRWLQINRPEHHTEIMKYVDEYALKSLDKEETKPEIVIDPNKEEEPLISAVMK